jgi:adaptin ear-binding coat-associated protein 1/2
MSASVWCPVGRGGLFAACFVPRGQRECVIEIVLDSSCYFVLCIEDGRGKHTFIGLGINERNEAFDFNIALSNHEKCVKREQKESIGEESSENSIDIHLIVSHQLKVKTLFFCLFNLSAIT